MTEKKRKKGISLRMQFFIVVVIAVALGFLAGAGTRMLGEELVNRLYMAPERCVERSHGQMDSFEVMVTKQCLSTGRADRITGWVRRMHYVYLVISGDHGVVFSSGWQGRWQYDDALYYDGDAALPILLPTGAGGMPVPEAVTSRRIAFADGTYEVRLYDYTAQPLRRIARWLGYSVGALVMLLVALIHHQRVIHRIIRLSGQVEEVAQGNIRGPIDVPSEDEIGDLSRHVSAMRDTVMERMQAEQRAWNANSALITRMSHDIRTPLTVLTGYLELMEEGEYSPDETYRAYLSTCRSNAAQLKELADTLFQYFLVYGHGNYELHPEVVDARTLMAQLIGEHVMLLKEKGWQTRTDPLDHAIPVWVDTVAMKRLMDNLFSNVEKYADPREPIYIEGRQEGEQIHILMRNVIRQDAAPAESSGIGLKTCERIAALLGGSFHTRKRDNTFQADIFLPVWTGQETQS